ncbi:hypothetical protein DYBT9275_03896 [Dyadobacter sp. CECT 9275]|uniref:Uncharacterized protein n=1 Tax=Dyadobacter helix TaxID=2822344 RepID=A0A916N5T5_9BACT|nr:hypothetical protein [Dyadobacter sp. CECT 9275]CAG5006786.1 hypothetical protein DYBT9275_03896 [Dyadobacter sp. CECT 9275]
MTAAYNPFEILNLPMIRYLIQHGRHFIVLQRFNWPGIKQGRGFMATPYADEKSAKQHQAQFEKITALIDNPRYYFFLCTFREEKWSEKMLKIYQRNILSFLKAHMSYGSSYAVDIHLHVKYGSLKAIVTANDVEYEFDVYEMIE